MSKAGGRRLKPRFTNTAVALAIVAFGVAIVLRLQRQLNVEQAYAALFATVLVTAASAGLWYGIGAAAIATVVLHLASTPGVLTPDSNDLVTFIIFCVGAWIAGLYAEEVRRDRRALIRLVAGTDVRSDFISRIPLLQSRLVRDVLSSAGALLLSLASIGIGSLLQRALGDGPISMIYLSGVVLSASMLGPRHALVTALANFLAYDYLVIEPRFSLKTDSLLAGVNLIVFLAVGWQVGRFADGLRYERRAVRRLFDAGRSFSGAADERSLRELLAEVVAAVTNARYVAVRDETGALSTEVGDASAAGEDAGEGLRERALGIDSPLGVVAWAPGRGGHDASIDETVGVLLELGAAAIARARLAEEHAHFEAIAQAEQLRHALLASVSHDLRTPLSGILASATSALDFWDRYTDDVRRLFLTNIREQAYRLRRYVENLLGMARLESGALEPRLVELDLEAALFETWEQIADGSGAARPTMEVEEGTRVLADHGLLQHVLGNIFENALKFTPEGGKITVAANRVGKNVVLTVCDEGPGVPPAELEQMFKPFVRGQNAKGVGVGLGLFIARSFLESMGGSIEARAGRAGGLCIEISLVEAASA